MTSASHLIEDSVRRLLEAGVPEARRDAVLLLATVLETEPWRLLLDPDTTVPDPAVRTYDGLIERREDREPVAYLMGFREFWSRAFEVSPGVLVPRPETEGLVEAALSLDLGASPRIVEVGAGSGCVSVSLALERAAARVTATEVSEAALSIARRNAARHLVDDRVEIRKGSGLAPVEDLAGGVDLVVSNPPYVSEREWEALEPEVREWEPREALVPGPTGLEMLEQLCGEAPRVLRPDGWLLLEVGAGQAGAVLALLEDHWMAEVRKDLAGIDRIVVAQWTASPSEE